MADMPNEESDKLVLAVANLRPEVLHHVEAALTELGYTTETQEGLMLSMDPPSYLDLVASVDFWVKCFGAVATIYVGALAKAAAEEHWKNRKEITAAALKGVATQAEKLRALIRKLSEATADQPGKFTVSFFADDQLRFRIDLKDEDAAIDTVARSVQIMRAAKKAITQIRDRTSGHFRTSAVTVELQDDGGFTVVWFSNERWGVYTRRYDCDGNAMGEEQRRE